MIATIPRKIAGSTVPMPAAEIETEFIAYMDRSAAEHVRTEYLPRWKEDGFVE